MKFIVPKGTPGMTIGGVEIKADGTGMIEVPDIGIEAALAFGFVLWKPGAEQPDPIVKGPDDEIDASKVTVGMIDSMSRKQLFEFLKDKGIASGATTPTDVLKILAKQEVGAAQTALMPNLQVKAR